MRSTPILVCLILASAVLGGCDRSDTPSPPPAPTTPPAAGAPSAAKTSPLAMAPAAVYPEDIDVDPQRDPRVRARAKELKAIAVAEMKNLKAGDEAVVLVRGDRGGGTIYGSGPYTLDSSLRKAVVHNGAVADRELGIVRIKVIKHEGAHPSVPANGIVPTKWGPYHTSYTIEKIEAL